MRKRFSACSTCVAVVVWHNLREKCVHSPVEQKVHLQVNLYSKSCTFLLYLVIYFPLLYTLVPDKEGRQSRRESPYINAHSISSYGRSGALLCFLLSVLKLYWLSVSETFLPRHLQRQEVDCCDFCFTKAFDVKFVESRTFRNPI